MSLTHIVARANENGNCTKETCAVIWSVYGYLPNLGATIFFFILFVASGIVYLYQGIKTKTKFFTWAMILGCVSEALGYVAKFILHNDPFSDLGFKMSVTLLTFAPAFYSAGIYYTLKHICLTFGPDFSRLRPAWYTWIFVSCDVFSILLQAIGGGLASASTTLELLNIGDDVMIAGLGSQVATLVVFGLFAADYCLAVYRNRTRLNQATEKLRNSLRFKFFIAALCVAYLGILARSSYRVAELVRGWRNNPILRSQNLFICLDSMPIGVATIVLNIWHPGYCFPRSEQEALVADEKLPASGGGSSDEEARV